MSVTLLLSDLHLPIAPSPLRDAFAAFLQGPARTSDAVYILGDLFETWLGDDVGLVDYADEVAQLRAASDAGVALYFMHGNRDFLVGKRFAAATNMTLLNDPIELMLAGLPTLLSHGDLYCTADTAYLRWRRFAHHRGVQSVFLKLPEKLRRSIGGAARGRSEIGKYHKLAAIMDVTDDAIISTFKQTPIDRIIHGHTHRPAEYRMQVNDREVERIVLADWTPQRKEYLRCTETTIERVLI